MDCIIYLYRSLIQVIFYSGNFQNFFNLTQPYFVTASVCSVLFLLSFYPRGPDENGS